MEYKTREFKPFTDAGFERRNFFSPFFVWRVTFFRGLVSLGIPIYPAAASYI